MRSIQRYLTEKTRRITYCDMDGVLCDWEKQFHKYAHMPVDEYKKKHDDVTMWKMINAAGSKFWETMEWMPDGKQLWNFLKPYKPTILSKPSLHLSSKVGKRLWLTREVGREIPYIFERDKSKITKHGDILIDDQEDNISEWVKAGGIGILHTSTSDTISKLKKVDIK